MLLLPLLLITFLDSLVGHLILVSYLLAATDEQAVWKRLRKLPPLLLSPLIASLSSFGMYALTQGFGTLRYFIFSAAVLTVCMAGILQVATSALVQILFLLFPAAAELEELAAMAAALLLSIAAAAVLKRLRFGVWFRLLLEDQPGLPRIAALLLALEVSMETFLVLQNGVQRQYLAAYYILVVVLVLVIIGLIVYLARRFDDSRTLRMQRDIIAQQQLYEQSLEDIRRETRAFRHDYKNLLAGLSQQLGEGRLDALRSTLSELDADFDRRLGENIQLSIQTGNLRLPQVRSLLLSKLADMRGKGVACRLEALYPVEAVGMNVWDFVRCLGVLVDNAAEAALDTERPWVEIILLAQDGRVFLRVSNPYANPIDPARIWDEGWSTKGAGRGLGLSGYQRILERYPNASACTGWASGVFVQELTVEDRA